LIARNVSPLVVAALLLAGCTTGQVGVTPPVSNSGGAPPGTLQLAVGTATMAQSNGTPFVGLNVVTTFRQSNGEPATVANTPTLSGPANFSANAPTQTPNSIYGLTPQTVQNAGNLYTRSKQLGQYQQQVEGSYFGSLVGAFGYGFAPDNIVGQAPNLTLFVGPANPLGNCLGIVPIDEIPTYGDFAGQQPAFNAIRYIALDLPVFSNGCPNGGANGGHNIQPFQYFGGPPAWPATQGNGIPTGFLGYPLGFTDFITAPVAGTYKLSVAYPSNANATTYSNVTASAVLPASSVSKPLPVFPQPNLRIQADGSGYVDVNVPAGVTEAVVIASTTRCDFGVLTQQSLPRQQYAIVTRHTGFQSLYLSSNLGPPDSSGNPLHTFCNAADKAQYGTTSAQYDLTAVGFDYPAYEASYPQSTTGTPAITNGDGHTGQADLTAANPQVQVSYPLQ
jgi:hypothetical protein